MTTTLPGTVPSCLPYDDAGPQWNYRARTLHHDKHKKEFPNLPSLLHLTPGQTVGLLVTSNGQLHLFLDGQHHKKIATGLPVDTPLWGAADVYGNCTEIESELLSCELGRVDLCVWVHKAVSCTFCTPFCYSLSVHANQRSEKCNEITAMSIDVYLTMRGQAALRYYVRLSLIGTYYSCTRAWE